MSSAAAVIYVQEYAAQDISKKHGKAQTCKNLSEVWVPCLKMEVVMFSQHSSKSVPTSQPIYGCTVFPTFPIFPHLCFLSYILNWTCPRLNPFKILNLRVNRYIDIDLHHRHHQREHLRKGAIGVLREKPNYHFPSLTPLHYKLHCRAGLLSTGSCTVFPHPVIALTLNHCTSHQVALKCIFAPPRSCILWIAMCRGDICVYLYLIFVFVFL